MFKTDKTKYKAGIVLNKGRRNPVKISREEVTSALNDYLEKGGKVIKLDALFDDYSTSESPFDPMDLTEEYNRSL